MGDINPETGRQIDQGSYGQEEVMNCPKRKGQGWGWVGGQAGGHFCTFLFLINANQNTKYAKQNVKLYQQITKNGWI